MVFPLAGMADESAQQGVLCLGRPIDSLGFTHKTPDAEICLLDFTSFDYIVVWDNDSFKHKIQFLYGRQAHGLSGHQLAAAIWPG